VPGADTKAGLCRKEPEALPQHVYGNVDSPGVDTKAGLCKKEPEAMPQHVYGNLDSKYNHYSLVISFEHKYCAHI
jgi:hypothetical protein